MKDDTERRTLDRTMAGKARSKDLTRRLVGYYANYFMFERNYFVTDISLDQVNCISYGMMALQGDGSLISSDEWADNYQIAALQFIKELNPSLQISLIVGGWHMVEHFLVQHADEGFGHLDTGHRPYLLP